jgi:membrane carboxypeptidase/penicillin-binding protein PbpC
MGWSASLTELQLQDNNARSAAFGPRSKLVIPNQIVSVKTGTTNDIKDNWTVGFTPEFLTITWVGNNSGEHMNPYLVSGVTGAAPIWNDIMSYVLANREPVWPAKPADVSSSPVCPDGMPPRKDKPCKTGSPELYWEASQPSASEYYTKEIWVKADTGLPPAPGESSDNLVLETHTVYGDPLTPAYCVDCRRPTNEEGKTVYERQTIPSDYIPGAQNTP